MLLHIKSMVTTRYQRPDTWEFRPQKIQLLSDIRSKYSKQLHCTLPITKLSEQLITDLKEVMHNHAGSCELHLSIAGEEENLAVTLRTAKQHIYPSDAFLQRLQSLLGVTHEEYHIST